MSWPSGLRSGAVGERLTYGLCVMASLAAKTATGSVGWLWVALGVVALNCNAAGQAQSLPGTIEVFTTTDRPLAGMTGTGSHFSLSGMDVQVYRLDGIDRVESALSRDLPSDPDAARRVALDRIRHLDAQAQESLRRSAVGLAKAAQYGIDRTPAVVFDGEAVVYGVTDLEQALGRYQQWRHGPGR